MVPSQKAEASVVPALQEEGAVQMGLKDTGAPGAAARRELGMEPTAGAGAGLH